MTPIIIKVLKPPDKLDMHIAPINNTAWLYVDIPSINAIPPREYQKITPLTIAAHIATIIAISDDHAIAIPTSHATSEHMIALINTVSFNATLSILFLTQITLPHAHKELNANYS